MQSSAAPAAAARSLYLTHAAAAARNISFAHASNVGIGFAVAVMQPKHLIPDTLFQHTFAQY